MALIFLKIIQEVGDIPMYYYINMPNYFLSKLRIKSFQIGPPSNKKIKVEKNTQQGTTLEI